MRKTQVIIFCWIQSHIRIQSGDSELGNQINLRNGHWWQPENILLWHKRVGEWVDQKEIATAQIILSKWNPPWGEIKERR